MATRFACASCGKSVEAPDELAGRKARCPHCQAVQVVPGSPRPKIPARMLASAPGPRVVKSHANQFAGGLMAAVALGAVIAVMYFLNPKSVAPAAGPQQAGLIASGSGAPPDPTPTPRATPVATATPAMAPYITPIPGSAPTTASAPAAGPTTQIASPSAPQPTTPAGPTPVAPYTPVVVAPGGNANPMAYVETLFSAKEIAAMGVSKTNLASVKKSLDMYAQMNDEKFPATVKEMIDQQVLSAMPASPGDKSQTYIYVCGQSPKSPAKNILVYDPHAYGRKRIIAMQIDGTIAEFNLEDIKKALTDQKAKADEMPK